MTLIENYQWLIIFNFMRLHYFTTVLEQDGSGSMIDIKNQVVFEFNDLIDLFEKSENFTLTI